MTEYLDDNYREDLLEARLEFGRRTALLDSCFRPGAAEDKYRPYMLDAAFREIIGMEVELSFAPTALVRTGATKGVLGYKPGICDQKLPVEMMGTVKGTIVLAHPGGIIISPLSPEEYEKASWQTDEWVGYRAEWGRVFAATLLPTLFEQESLRHSMYDLTGTEEPQSKPEETGLAEVQDETDTNVDEPQEIQIAA